MPDFLLLLVICLVIAWAFLSRRISFAGQRPDDYAETTPVVDIRQNLSGPLACEGVIYGPTGRVNSRFVAEMTGQWDGDEGRLAEHFHYAGGNEQHREWRLTLVGDGRIQAEADDIIGAGQGWQSGATVMLRYRIRLPENAGGWTLDVTDWMYLLDNGTIINRSQFRKFGVKVAELVATMRPVEAHAKATRLESTATDTSTPPAARRILRPFDRTEAA